MESEASLSKPVTFIENLFMAGTMLSTLITAPCLIFTLGLTFLWPYVGTYFRDPEIKGLKEMV